MLDITLRPGQIFNIYALRSGKTFLTKCDISPMDSDMRISYSKKEKAVAAFKVKALKNV